MTVDYAHYESPIGLMILAVNDRGLCALLFEASRARLGQYLEGKFGPVSLRQTALPRVIGRRLDAYFAGQLDALDGVAAAPAGTPFQQRVWSALRKVPPGTTTSYHVLAESVGCRGGAQAVGAANAANPVCLVIPCHRVIRADGHISGYGGGVERKEWLLRHEGVPMDAVLR